MPKMSAKTQTESPQKEAPSAGGIG